MATSAAQASRMRITRERWLTLALFVVGLYIVLPQVGGLGKSFAALESALVSYLWMAVLAIAASYLCAAGTYYFLASKPLSYRRTVIVQLAATFINRLIPAGIGGMGANYVYLRKNGYKTGAAGSVVATNNLIGFIGHMILVVSLVGVFHGSLGRSYTLSAHIHYWLALGAVLFGLIIGLSIWHFRRQLKRFNKQTNKQLKYYWRKPWKLLLALSTSIGLTICNAAALWCCAASLHHQLPILVILLVLTLGLAVGTATPTPGGLGGVEAGLVAGLVAYHMPASLALTTALIYRLISYWLPLVGGAITFPIVRRRGYL